MSATEQKSQKTFDKCRLYFMQRARVKAVYYDTPLSKCFYMLNKNFIQIENLDATLFSRHVDVQVPFCVFPDLFMCLLRFTVGLQPFTGMNSAPTHARMHARTHARTRIADYTRKYMYMHARTQTHTYTHFDIHTHARTHKYVDTCARKFLYGASSQSTHTDPVSIFSETIGLFHSGFSQDVQSCVFPDLTVTTSNNNTVCFRQIQLFLNSLFDRQYVRGPDRRRSAM